MTGCGVAATMAGMSTNPTTGVAYHRTDPTATVLHEHGDCADYCAAPIRRQLEARLLASLARHAYHSYRAALAADGPASTFEHDAVRHQHTAARLYSEAREMVA